jgi:UDP-N-acetylglucosamine:LPS N-acetylglucosamine transferase
VRQEEAAGRVEFHSYLDSARQQEMMNRSRFFVSRSGYTSMMELAEIGLRHALLIPTPGQTEQEYLGDYYEEKGYFHHVDQYTLTLQSDISRARGLTGFSPPWRTDESRRRFLEVIGARETAAVR